MKSHALKLRSFLKALTWRVFATTLTTAMIYEATGSGKLAFSFGAVETAIKVVTYYAHERVWDHVDWGKR